MSLAPNAIATKLSFAKFANDVRQCSGVLNSSEGEIQKEIIAQAPSWVAAHVNDVKNCEVIHLEGTVGHANWTPKVREAIEKRLPAHRNSAGKKITLRADGDR